MKSAHAGFACALVCLFIVSSAWSADEQKDTKEDASAAPADSLTKAIAALAVPDSPAFAVLGVTPKSVTRPATPNALALGLLQGTDANGNLQSGLAVDTSPYLLFKGDRFTIGEYRERKTRRNLANLQLSLATAKGSDPDDKSLRLSGGLRYVIFDKGDPYEDETLDTCMKSAFEAGHKMREEFEKVEKAVGDSEQPFNPEDFLRQIAPLGTQEAQLIEKGAAKCRADHAKRAWNASAWDVGIAPTWTSVTGETSDLKDSGYATWSSYAVGFKNGQLILHAKYRTDELVEDPLDSSAKIQQDSFSAGLRVRYGNERRTFLAEGIYIDEKPQGRKKDNSYRYLIGGEFRITKTMWIQLLTGSTSGSAFKKNDGFITSQFQWAIVDDSQLD